MSRTEIKSLLSQRICGVWFHQPFPNTIEVDEQALRSVQLVSFNGAIYHVTDPLSILKILQATPTIIKFCYGRKAQAENSKALYLPFDSILPWSLWSHMRKQLILPVIDHRKLHLCWLEGIKLGINIMINTADFRNAEVPRSIMEQIAKGLIDSLDYFVTRIDIAAENHRKSLIASEGVVLLKCVPDTILQTTSEWCVGGPDNRNELFQIYALSKKDLCVTCKQAIDLLSSKTDIRPVYPHLFEQVFTRRVITNTKKSVAKILRSLLSNIGGKSIKVSYEISAANHMSLEQGLSVEGNLITAIRSFKACENQMLAYVFGGIDAIKILSSQKYNSPNVVKRKKSTLTIYPLMQSEVVPHKVIQVALIESIDCLDK